MKSGGLPEPVSSTGLAISPDGARTAMLFLQRGEAYLWLCDAAARRPVEEIALPGGRPGGLVWSPDGSMLAYYGPSAQATLGQDVYVLRVGSKEARSVTLGLLGHAHIPCWAPDSERLAFASYEPPIRADHPPHLFTVSVSTGRIEQRTFSASSDFTPQFSPDRQALAFRREGDLWLLDLAGGGERRLTQVGTAKLGHGCFSPDGRQIVFDVGPIGDARRIAVVDIETGGLRMLTPPETDAGSPCWAPTSGAISYVEAGRRVVVIGPEGSLRWTATLPGQGILASPSLAPRWAARANQLVLMDADGNAWISDPGADPLQVTFFPPKPAPGAIPERVSYPGYGGASVPALLFRPPGFDPARGGAVLWIHGGPHNEADPRDSYAQAMVAAGLLVLAPDYRGSTGHGAEWARLTPDQAGIVDLQDVVAGHEFLIAASLAPPPCIGIAGCSYGGYLALLALARHPDRWVAGASLWGIWDARRSPPLMREALRRDAAWVAERSPAAVLDRIRAPLLILHGAEDTQSTVEEVQAAVAQLTRQERPCETTIFTDDGHGLGRHTAECGELLTAFFQRYPEQVLGA